MEQRLLNQYVNDLDARRRLVVAVTDAATNYYGLPRETIVVVVKDNPPDKVAVGGTLVADR